MADRHRATRRKARKEKKRSTLGLWTGALILVLVGAYVALIQVNRPTVPGDRLRLDSFVDLAERGRLKSARILNYDSYAVGNYERDDGSTHRYAAVYLKESQDLLVNTLLENRVATTVDQQTKKRIVTLIGNLLPALVLIILFAYLILSSRRGTGLFKVRSGARRIEPEPGGVTFADVAGQDAAVEELREIKEYLADPARYVEVGAQIPKGVLLYGPPGCGKTMLAKAVAGEAGAAFFSISGSDFVEVFVGVGAARVRDLFREAREHAPAVIFIDELDAIGRSRSGQMAVADNTERDQALNQILSEMDGFSTGEGIIVLAATNRPDVLDPALLRPGRFDRTVGLDRPDEGARLAILSLHAKGKRLDGAVDLADIASRAHGFTGADLANVLNEAALLAARSGRTVITQRELDEALQRVLGAPERQRRLALRDRSIGRRYSERDKITFADVAGQDAAVAELREIKEYLAEPERYAAVGAKIPRGVLLFGPPGCGKTLMARALAGEANAAFLSISASEVMGALVGESAARIRDLFAEARQMAPAILFIDELDSLGHSRAGGLGADRGAAGGTDEQALNQVLTELDGFTQSTGVIVVGATNRAEVLDPALLRPGRFDRTVGLDWPNEAARLAILELHARSRSLADDADLGAVASRAHGLNGADLANLVNEAALLAARQDRASVTREDLDEALKRAINAPDRQRRLSMRAKSVGRRYGADERVTFADVAGVDDAITELLDVRDYLAEPDRFVRMGAAPPRGILLSGPPGCGKTLLARAVAGESNAAFISAAGSDFVEVFVGEGAARVRDLFAEARSMAPAIVFIDEIDAVGGHRDATVAGGGSREVDATLNQLLVELDGFEGREAVIVMGATNRPDMLDAALRRAGRFDRTIDVTLPDRKGRRDILDVHAQGKPLGPDVDLDKLAALTPQFSGADLANVLNESALLATRKGLETITMDVVDEAIDRAYLGITSKRHLLNDEERRVVAYHEAGHAVVALFAPGAAPPYKVTILPRGGAAGYCTTLDEHDHVVSSRSRMLADMAVSVGGWASELLVFGETSAGTRGDLVRLNRMAREMVCDLGMSEEFGAMLPGDRTDSGRPPGLGPDVTTAVRRIVDDATARAEAILVAHRPLLDRVTSALLQRETLTRADIAALAAEDAGSGSPALLSTPG